MNPARFFGLVASLICMIGIVAAIKAAEPVARPATLWNFLGIPQGLQKIRDVSVNRHGNFPGLERKDPLKRIADPANLELENPAIQKAAEIKAKEDLAKQKIKAIKYLATIGCDRCYKGVDEALLEGLKDCTEAVRLEAAKAVEQAAGSPCDICGGQGCCNAKMMTKLHELAYGKDDKCCYIEPSEQVRAAAKSALESCSRLVPPAPGPPEVETPSPPRETAPPSSNPSSNPSSDPASDVEMPSPVDQGDPFLPSPPEVEQPKPFEDREPSELMPTSPAPDNEEIPESGPKPTANDSPTIINPISMTVLTGIDDIQFAYRQVPVSRQKAPAGQRPKLGPEDSDRRKIKLTAYRPIRQPPAIWLKR